MHIQRKTEPDPASRGFLIDVYMLWALLAMEEVLGKAGLNTLLERSGLERFVDNYPAAEETLDAQVRFDEYAALNASMYEVYGNASRMMSLRIGRLSTRHSLQQQNALFNVAALTAARFMSYERQVKMVLDSMETGFRKIYAQHNQSDLHLATSEEEDQFIYSTRDCAQCAGHKADAPLCAIQDGIFQEAIHWLTGKEPDVSEIACRAMGTDMCVWTIAKAPLKS